MRFLSVFKKETFFLMVSCNPSTLRQLLTSFSLTEFLPQDPHTFPSEGITEEICFALAWKRKTQTFILLPASTLLLSSCFSPSHTSSPALTLAESHDSKPIVPLRREPDLRICAVQNLCSRITVNIFTKTYAK